MMRFIIAFAVLYAFAFAAACSVGPHYVKPAASIPAGYKEMDGWKVAQPRDDSLRGRWWELFNDPQLNALEEQVNISNQNVLVAEAQFRQARALVRVARASYFPTMTADASFTRSRRSFGSSGLSGTGSAGGISGAGRGTATAASTISDYSLPVDVTWDLDVWGRVRRTVEANQASAQASAADLETVRLSAQTELAQDYFQLRALDAQKQIMEETIMLYQKSLELTKNRYASGIASRADVLQAETQLKTTQAQAIDIGVQRTQLEHAIALLTGGPASVFSIPAAPLTTGPPAIPVGMPSELLERRPDIAAAERRVAAANAQIGVAEAAFFPSLTLSASGGFENSIASKWLTWPSRFWSIGSTITEAVFEGGLRLAQTEEARAAYDANVASYRQAVLTGFQQVEDNLAALRILEEESLAQEEAVKAAEQSVVYATNQYKAGTLSYLNVVIAQTAALSNRRVAVDLLGRRMTAGVLLIKALGGGWQASKQ